MNFTQECAVVAVPSFGALPQLASDYLLSETMEQIAASKKILRNNSIAARDLLLRAMREYLTVDDVRYVHMNVFLLQD